MAKNVDHGQFVRRLARVMPGLSRGLQGRFLIQHRDCRLVARDVVVVRVDASNRQHVFLSETKARQHLAYGVLAGVYPTREAAVTAARVEYGDMDDELDSLQNAAEVLVDQVTAHADAVERRGDEIDALLAQIRAIRPEQPAS